MKRTISKIIFLIFAVMQIVATHAMLTQAGHTALCVAGKRALSSDITPAQNTIKLVEKLTSSSGSKINRTSIADTLKITALHNAYDKRNTKYIRQTYRSQKGSSPDDLFFSCRPQRFGHKSFVYGSFISTLALYAYMSTEPENTEPVTQKFYTIICTT